jgi:mannose-6-phosphate isomerase-like protein (cupin superfamily)
MFIRDFHKCVPFVAGDNSILRELLHPDKDALGLGYSLAHARVPPGEATLPHRLKSSEVYYILSGAGLMFIEGQSAPVAPGQAIYIPPHAEQRIENLGSVDLEFLCIVDPAWRPEDEEVL